MRYKITEGPITRPQKLLIYGPEGIGKSTLASQLPNPIFIDVEDGTGHLYALRLPVPLSWVMLIDECRSVIEDPGDVSTIVVDSIDAAEQLCHQKVCKTAKKASIESWGYGKGYTIAAEKFNELLNVLDECVRAGINVVLIAHSQMRKFERPDESGAYDRFEIKMHKLVASKVKEWSDAVLFLDYETFVSMDDSGKGHASGGKRVIRTSHNVSWDAKNRWGLPEKLPLDDSGVEAIRVHIPVRGSNATTSTQPAPASTTPTPQKTTTATKPVANKPQQTKKSPFISKCEESGIDPIEIKAVMISKGKRKENQPVSEWEEPFINWLMSHWDRVVELVMEYRESDEYAPF